MQINDQGTFYVEGEYKAGDTILTAGDWELKADVDGYKKYAFGYEPEDFPELITNGTFDTDISGWIGVGDYTSWIIGGVARVGGLTKTNGLLYQKISSSGRHRVSFDFSNKTGSGGITIRADSSDTYGGYIYTSAGNSGSVSFTVDTVFSAFGIRVSGGDCYYDLDNISVKLAHPKAGDTIQLGSGNHKDFRYYPYKLSATDIQELTR